MNRWGSVASSAGLLLLLFCGWRLLDPRPAPQFSPADRPQARLKVPLPEQEEEERQENILAIYENTFRCTIYYTPKESGVTQEGGFDVATETRSGLQNRKFPRDFLKAVELEGFGKLAEPVDGKAYLQYSGKAWRFADQPLDNRGRPLIAKRSCAIAQPHALITSNAFLSIRSPGLPTEFHKFRWRVCDTGSGLGAKQIDLYWGEDDPLGPGRKLSKPKGFNGEMQNPTITVLADVRVSSR